VIKSIIPYCLGIYVNFQTRINVLKIINFIKKNKDLDKIKIILGGPDVRYYAENYLNGFADYIVVGEGEITFYQLVKRLMSGNEINNIKGLVYIGKNNVIQDTGPRDNIKNLDTLPFPERNWINYKLYFKTWKQKHGYNSITISTQRGCPYECNWCSHSVFGETYRRRSPKSVVNEIDKLSKQYLPDQFWFVDDVFTMSKEWIVKFNKELRARELKIKYECITRADRLDSEIIENLKQSGCKMLWIGAESGSQKIINLMNRKVDLKRVQQMIKISKKTGIKTGTFIMLGYPDETVIDINKTIKHLKECNPDLFTITLAYPIKGTKLYEKVSSKFIKKYDWQKNSDRDMDFKRTYKNKFYDFAIRKVSNELFAYKAYIKKNLYKYVKYKIKSSIASGWNSTS